MESVTRFPTDPRDPAMQLRAALPDPVLTDADRGALIEQIAATEVLRDLIRTYGAKRVHSWLRNLAALEGQEV